MLKICTVRSSSNGSDLLDVVNVGKFDCQGIRIHAHYHVVTVELGCTLAQYISNKIWEKKVKVRGICHTIYVLFLFLTGIYGQLFFRFHYKIYIVYKQKFSYENDFVAYVNIGTTFTVPKSLNCNLNLFLLS